MFGFFPLSETGFGGTPLPGKTFISRLGLFASAVIVISVLVVVMPDRIHRSRTRYVDIKLWERSHKDKSLPETSQMISTSYLLSLQVVEELSNQLV